jgi:thioredoxin reductase (NADPH)
MLDCLIVGGGPAGLIASTYLARFRRKIRLIDGGQSRAALIPESHNYPGFRGIGGCQLLDRLRDQAARFGVDVERGEVTALERGPDHGFIAHSGHEHINTRHVLLATGIVDHAPSIEGLETEIYKGAIRFCPICDAYEALDVRIGVLGAPASAEGKALFLRTYSRRVIAFLTEVPSDEQAVTLRKADIQFFCDPIRVDRLDNRVSVLCEAGKSVELDVLYPAMGCDVRSQLAIGLGCRKTSSGNLEVDSRQCTSIFGLYAAGDVVSDLHQISVALGHASVAASAIHNSLPPNPR